MSIHQFFNNLQDVGQESPLLEALRKVRMASLEQVTEDGSVDNEWPIWNEPAPPPPVQTAQVAAPFDKWLQWATQTANT